MFTGYRRSHQCYQNLRVYVDTINSKLKYTYILEEVVINGVKTDKKASSKIPNTNSEAKIIEVVAINGLCFGK
jgi:hypothetical protein